MARSERGARPAVDGDPTPRTLGWILILLVALLLTGLALDGKHYWHEVRFLYVSTQFSLDEALAGSFNPQQAGGPIDELGASGFYSTKALQIILLKSWFRLIEPSAGGFVLACVGSLLAVLATAAIVCDVFRRISVPDLDPRWGLVCLLIAPVTPYLAGKLLSEVTALLFLASALWAFVVGLKTAGRAAGWPFAASASVLALTALARLDMIVSFVGFVLAAAVFVPRSLGGRTKIAKAGALVLVVGGVAWVASLVGLGVDLRGVLRYFNNYVALHPKSHVMSLLGLVTFGGLVYLPAFVALAKRSRAAMLFGTWWAVAALPLIAITANYMVEPRYLSASLIPLAGLGGVGLSEMWRWTNRRKPVALIAATVLTAAVNYLLIGLMPFEVDRPALLGVVDDVRRRSDGAVIVVPWAYTDYHFLRVLAPKRRIYNVNTPAQQAVPSADAWRARFHEWYGQGYLDDPARLNEMIAGGEVYYVGWRKYPPLQAWILRARRLGFDQWADRLERLPLQDHLRTSWLWDAEGFRLTKVDQVGQYEIYEVRPSGDQ